MSEEPLKLEITISEPTKPVRRVRYILDGKIIEEDQFAVEGELCRIPAGARLIQLTLEPAIPPTVSLAIGKLAH